MFVELLESLRCPNEHAESPLIVAASRTEARHVMDGTLGCPVCSAEFPIANGVARFGEATRPPHDAPSAEVAMRLAAFLELGDGRGLAMLHGRWASHADQLLRLVQVPLILVNAPAGADADVAGSIRVGDRMPFAAGAARAVAFDVSASTPLRQSLVACVRDGGRVVAPAGAPVPPGVEEIARDDRDWVGKKVGTPDAAPRLISLTRGAPPR